MNASGATGAAAGGAIIPFASGIPLALTTLVGGLVGTVGLVGFGSSGPTVTLAGGTIDLTGAAGTLLNSRLTHREPVPSLASPLPSAPRWRSPWWGRRLRLQHNCTAHRLRAMFSHRSQALSSPWLRLLRASSLSVR